MSRHFVDAAHLSQESADHVYFALIRENDCRIILSAESVDSLQSANPRCLKRIFPPPFLLGLSLVNSDRKVLDREFSVLVLQQLPIQAEALLGFPIQIFHGAAAIDKVFCLQFLPWRDPIAIPQGASECNQQIERFKPELLIYQETTKNKIQPD